MSFSPKLPTVPPVPSVPQAPATDGHGRISARVEQYIATTPCMRPDSSNPPADEPMGRFEVELPFEAPSEESAGGVPVALLKAVSGLAGGAPPDQEAGTRSWASPDPPPESTRSEASPIQRATTAASGIFPGAVVANRFALFERTGAGGTVEVYRALDRLANRFDPDHSIVAFKVLSRRVSADAAASAAVLGAAARVRRLRHPNVEEVLELHQFDDDAVVVTEWLEGESLAARFDREGPFRLEVLRPVLTALDDALGHVHGHGVVHGDIKPGNVFLCADGQVKLFDFGYRIPVQSDDTAGSRPPGITPFYASCEALENQLRTPEDDVYSVACLTYRMLTGEWAWGERTALEAEAAGARAIRPPALTREQWKSLQRGLSFRREDRPATVAELLRPFLLQERTRSASRERTVNADGDAADARADRSAGAGVGVGAGAGAGVGSGAGAGKHAGVHLPKMQGRPPRVVLAGLVILFGAALAWSSWPSLMPSQPEPAGRIEPLRAAQQAGTPQAVSSQAVSSQAVSSQAVSSQAVGPKVGAPVDQRPALTAMPGTVPLLLSASALAPWASPEPASLTGFDGAPIDPAPSSVESPSDEVVTRPKKRVAVLPTIGFETSRVTVPMSTRFIKLKVRAAGRLRGPVELYVGAVDGSARVNEDYVPPVSRLTLNPRTPTGEVLISLLNGTPRRNLEDFSVVLALENGDAKLGTSNALVVLLDD